MGCRGGMAHQRIINRVESLLVDEYEFIKADHCMVNFLSQKERPDFIVKSGKDFIVGEVGKFNPDKWPTNVPVIHIGFNGRVTPLPRRGEPCKPFELAVYNLICSELGYIPDDDNGEINFKYLEYNCDDERVNIILTLIKKGKTILNIHELKHAKLRAVDNKNKGSHLTEPAIKHLLRNNAT